MLGYIIYIPVRSYSYGNKNSDRIDFYRYLH